MIREFFLQDCDESTTEQVVSRLTRQSLTPFTQPPHQIAWQRKPASYFVCTEDLATPPEAQRQRVRADTRLVQFCAGDHPFLSRPDEFAEASSPRSTRIEQSTNGFCLVAVEDFSESWLLSAGEQQRA